METAYRRRGVSVAAYPSTTETTRPKSGGESGILSQEFKCCYVHIPILVGFISRVPDATSNFIPIALSNMYNALGYID